MQLASSGLTGGLILYGLGGMAFTALFLYLLRKPAVQVKLIDCPTSRKRHEGSIPLTGGPAIFISLIVCYLLWRSEVLIVAMGLVLMVGLIDDLRQLSPRIRLVAQTLVALMMVLWGGQVVDDLGDLFGFGILHLGILAIPFTVLCVVGLINAFNMADGVDGLAAGLAAAAMLWLFIAARIAGTIIPPHLPILLAAVVGFMFINARHPLNPRAAAFLGDSGSMLLGVGLAWFAIVLTQGPNRALPSASVLWILGLPVIDTLRVTIRRLYNRQSPFEAGRDHFHHILLDLGLSPGQTSWLVVAVSSVLGGIGVLAPHFGVPEPVLTYGFLVMAACFWVFTPAPHGEQARALGNQLHRPETRGNDGGLQPRPTALPSNPNDYVPKEGGKAAWPKLRPFHERYPKPKDEVAGVEQEMDRKRLCPLPMRREVEEPLSAVVNRDI
ncbi:MraY family glycosyltransferase [Methylocaldum sp. RMAD-M]|uniref:MraY family glycosyltransferase n=1 Tax=Methylocaldum sp. RMAD-M TaxID=2806557 RepID=UPI00143D9A85|nr:MraY family glycosyltransferase [Methylocaldum sp. RMAD-M]MBP1152810.1 UDP-GlcNAc:undecaprenyl-phosphate GlcNAc-1-phosphate transferase [Methylocaldum sp. RMAD-M]